MWRDLTSRPGQAAALFALLAGLCVVFSAIRYATRGEPGIAGLFAAPMLVVAIVFAIVWLVRRRAKG